MRMVAVVLGGGVGQRLGAGMPKQLLTLGGTTLIERCVTAFEAAPGVDEILVVMARGYTGKVEALLAEGGCRKVTGVIEGGQTRPGSTRVALAAIAADGAGADEDALPGGAGGGGDGEQALTGPLGRVDPVDAERGQLAAQQPLPAGVDLVRPPRQDQRYRHACPPSGRGPP